MVLREENEVKKGFIVVLALMLILRMIVVSAYAGGSPFIDVDESYWSYDNVVRMANEGIISGYPDKTFKPEDPRHILGN